MAEIQLISEREIEDIIRPIKKPPKIRSDHDISLIQEKTRNIPFFQKYIQENKQNIHQECCKYMTYEKHEEGNFIFQQGDRGTKFYIILYGKVGVFLKIQNEQKKVKELYSGDSFGELALINDSPRSASIRCMIDCYLAVLDKKNYITLFQQILDNEIKKEISFYPEIELFSNWNYNKIKSFYNHSFRISVRKGDKIIQEGERIDAIYIISSGEFIAKKSKSQQEAEQEQKSDLNRLRRLGLAPVSVINSKTPLFIMTSYEIFGQEGLEIDSRVFQYSVECQSYEGRLIYIKLQDYMKIIYKEEQQRQYMKLYSYRRLSRVKERIHEVSQIHQLKDKTDCEPIKVIEATPSQQAAFQLFGNTNEGDESALETSTTQQGSKKRKGSNKRQSIIDIIAKNPNMISSHDNLHNHVIDKFNEKILEKKRFSNNSGSKSNFLPNQDNFNNIGGVGNAADGITQTNAVNGEESKKQLIKKQLSSEGLEYDNFNMNKQLSPQNIRSQRKSLLLPNSAQNSNHLINLLQIQIETRENEKQLNRTDSFNKLKTKVFVNSIPEKCYTPVSLRSQSLNRLQASQVENSKKKNGYLYESSSNNQTIPEANANKEEIESQIYSAKNADTKEISKKRDKKKKHDIFSKDFTTKYIQQIFESNKFEQDFESKIHVDHHSYHNSQSITDLQEGTNYYQKQKENNSQQQRKRSSESNINEEQIPMNQLPQLNQQDIQRIENYQSMNNLNNSPNNNEKVHPLVKGFHDQLKLRFYSKFKQGQIEDLKQHISSNLVQSLNSKVEGDKRKFSQSVQQKKTKDTRIKELREYEQKLRMVIRLNGNEGSFSNISPLHNKSTRRNANKTYDGFFNNSEDSNNSNNSNRNNNNTNKNHDCLQPLNSTPQQIVNKSTLNSSQTCRDKKVIELQPLTYNADSSISKQKMKNELDLKKLLSGGQGESNIKRNFRSKKELNLSVSNKDSTFTSSKSSSSIRGGNKSMSEMNNFSKSSQLNSSFLEIQEHDAHHITQENHKANKNDFNSPLLQQNMIIPKSEFRPSSLESSKACSPSKIKFEHRILSKDISEKGKKQIYVNNFPRQQQQVFLLKQKNCNNLKQLSDEIDSIDKQSQLIKSMNLLENSSSSHNLSNINTNQSLSSNTLQFHQKYRTTTPLKLINQIPLGNKEFSLSPHTSYRKGFKGSQGFNLSQFQMRREKNVK